MFRRVLSIALTSALAGALFVVPAATPRARAQQPPTVRAGYGEADATWHVGAGAGQYSSKSPDQAGLVTGGGVDPQQHSLTQKDSYGVHSRLSYRAIVVEDGEGDQVAFVKSDSYLAQDYLSRRVGQILEAEGSAVSYDEIFHMASHNHSSPYYMSPSWGVWVFQDAFDMRAFEYHARQMAASILEAEQNLVPARMGATSVEHLLFKGMIQRKRLADDGTPAGYPDDFGDMGLAVIRFDSLEDPDNPKPLATLINWGMHPEGLNDHDLITGDFVASLERFVERATGAPLVFGQGDVGSAEAGPGRRDLMPAGIPKRWSHSGHAQAERGGFLLSRDAIRGWEQIGSGTPDAAFPTTFVEFDSDFDVEAGNAFVPGPLSHPYPSVSNCRTESTVEGNPGAPVAGLPDCARARNSDSRSQMIWENLKAHGIPVPEHYDAPSFTGVEENLRLKLQAFKLGEVLLASCACEAQVDLILNIESRADETQGNIWDGYDWTERLGCTQAEEGGDWTCRHVNGQSNITISDYHYRRMKAQIHNDAAGWNDDENVIAAQSEPEDPEQIWGNFTKEELPTDLGYKLPIGVGHSGDYNGYTVSYREYMGYDEYRKALTAYGPHTADYMATRLVRLAGELNGGPPLEEVDHETIRGGFDETRMLASSTALGAATSAEYDAWRSSLPNDKGPARVLTQPKDIKRFDASTFSWIGGSNAVDNPTVRVERLVDGEWTTFADQSGEVQTMLEFPKGANGFFNAHSGNHEWRWTANFEAFDAFPKAIGSTPAGTYRFVVDGLIRQSRVDQPYSFASEDFTVSPWDGIAVTDIAADATGVSFRIPNIAYPETYTSPFSYVGKSMMTDEVGVPFCETCSFRPWAVKGEVDTATLTIERRNGTVQRVAATRQDDGSWRVPTTLFVGERAYVERAGVVDEYGEINGARSEIVEGTVEPTPILTLAMSMPWSGPTLRVKLVDADGAPIAGAPISYFADGVWMRTNNTNARGETSLRIPTKYLGAKMFEAKFPGNAQHRPASARLQNG